MSRSQKLSAIIRNYRCFHKARQLFLQAMSPAVVPMSRHRPKPLEQKPWRGSNNSAKAEPAAVQPKLPIAAPEVKLAAVGTSRVQPARPRLGTVALESKPLLEAREHAKTSPKEMGGPMSRSGASHGSYELNELSRLPTDGPLVSVNQARRDLVRLPNLPASSLCSTSGQKISGP